MTDHLIEQYGPRWTSDTPANRPDVDPILVELWRMEAPFDPNAAALYEWATTPEGNL